VVEVPVGLFAVLCFMALCGVIGVIVFALVMADITAAGTQCSLPPFIPQAPPENEPK
jgi:hypothetical protein